MDVFELYAKLGLDTSEYEEGLNDAEHKASGFGSALKSGIGGAAKIGAAAVAATTAAVVGGSAALVKGAGDVASYGDNIDKMSQKMGISAEAYQEWDAIMQHSGTSIEALKPSMKTLANAAQKGADEFEKLGISEEEVKNLSQEDLFSRVITGLQGMEEGTERTAITSKLLGRGATELGALLNTSAEETQAMRDRVHELGGVMSDDAVKASAKFQDTLQDMQTGFDGLKRNMIAEFMPSITTVMNGLTDLFTGQDARGLDKMADGIFDFVDKVSDAMPKLLEVGSRIITSLGEGIVKNLPKLTTAVIDVVKNLGGMIIEQLPMLAETGLQILVQLINSMAEALPTLIPTIVDVLLQIVQVLIDNAGALVEASIALMQGLADGFLEAIPILVGKIPELILQFIDAFTNNIDGIIQTGVQIIVAIIQGLSQALPQLIAKMPEIIMALFNALIVAIPQLLQAGVQIIGELIKGIASMVPVLVAEAPKMIMAFIQGILDLRERLKQTGHEIIDHIKNAISENIKDAINWGKDLVSNFISGLKSKWGDLKASASNLGSIIKSHIGFSEPDEGPLSNFHTYAPDMVDLFVQGIKDNAGKVTRAVDSMAGDVYDAMPTFATAGGYDIMSAGGYAESDESGDIVTAITDALMNMQLCVNIGNRPIEAMITDAQQKTNYRSGGR